MQDPFDRRSDPDRSPRPSLGACLVDGCACKDPRIISPRRVAFFARWARDHGETADRQIEPDADSRELLRTWRERVLGNPERPGLAALTNGPSRSGGRGW
jgi:hypothetical protein